MLFICIRLQIICLLTLSTVVECLTVASGIFAMLGVANQLSIATMESFASTFHMPIVIPSAVMPTSPPTMASRPPPTSPSPLLPSTAAGQAHHRPAAAAAAADRPYAIYVRPAYDVAVLALIRRFDWKHLFYLYDTEQGQLSLSVSLSLISHFYCDFFVAELREVSVYLFLLLTVSQKRCTSASRRFITIFTVKPSLSIDNGICIFAICGVIRAFYFTCTLRNVYRVFQKNRKKFNAP